MVSLNRVSIGVDVDADTALYIGQLEGTVASLVINECKYRCLLELITGEPWDTNKLSAPNADIHAIAAETLAKQFGVSQDTATKLVKSRSKLTESQPVPNPAHTTTQLSMQDRLQRWKARNADRLKNMP